MALADNNSATRLPFSGQHLQVVCVFNSQEMMVFEKGADDTLCCYSLILLPTHLGGEVSVELGAVVAPVAELLGADV